MTPQTMRAIKAILEADQSVSDADRSAILSVCRDPMGTAGEGDPSRQRFVSPRETAKILNTSIGTVWRLARKGRLRRIKLGHRCTRFRLEDIEKISFADAPPPELP